MQEFALILIGITLVNNVVLAQFLGLCPLLGVSRSFKSAGGMCLATTFVLTLSAAFSYLLNAHILIPLQLEYLRILAFILVIAITVQLIELLIRHSSPLLHKTLGVYLPLITTNCAVLGVALLNTQQQQQGLWGATLYGFGAGAGFSLVLMLFAAMRERLAAADVPKPFQGTPIALITAGLMSLAFMGFAGLVRH